MSALRLKQNLKDKRNNLKLNCLIPFFCSLGLFILWLRNKDMIWGGDAPDIWKTIVSWHDDNTYRSYVMYKGFLSVHPYIELYDFAQVVGLESFFFIKLLWALLFSSLTTLIIPKIIKIIFNLEEQGSILKILFSLVCFYFWRKSNALSLLMVDLPSVFLLFLSMYFAIKVRFYLDKNILGARLQVMVTVTSVLLGLLASCSGQYILSVIIIFCYLAIILFRGYKLGFIIESISYALTVTLCKLWYMLNVKPYGVAEGMAWLERGLLYMMNMVTFTSSIHVGIDSRRGYEILSDYLGSNDLADAALLEAQMGGKAWTIQEYLMIVFKYPMDFICVYIERISLILSYESYSYRLLALVIQYTLISAAIVIIVRNLKNLSFNGAMVLGACFASVIPVLVLTVEMRYGLAFQGILWAIPILSFEQWGKQFKGYGRLTKIKLLLVVFICVIFEIAYISEVYAQGSVNLPLLFKAY